MKIKNILILSLFIFSSFFCFSQRSKDGSKTITAANTVVNEYTSLTSNANAGATSISVAASGLNSNNRFSGSLSAGDLIMIIQVQGASISTGAQELYWGQITNYNNCGLYEFAQVLSVPNSTTINIECSLTNNYTASGHTVVVRMPRYSSLTVNSGGVLTCDTWNGTTGGILAVEIEVATTIISGGSIDVSGKGFRGGLISNNTKTALGIGEYYFPKDTFGSEKGEGIAGFQADYDVIGGRYCRGAAANGGGGGNAHNHGGGGGANAGDTSLWTGKGIPDISTANWAQAWELEETGFSTSSSSGGGRGGYSFSSKNLNALTVGPWTPTNQIIAWGGDFRCTRGGLGGRPLDYSTGRIFMGGGGGSGNENDGYGSSGANGGGIILIQSYGTISGSGQILSNGANAANATSGNGISNSYSDAAGGGGAGGTILLKSVGNISGINACANGGKGGNQVIASTNTTLQAEGPGGGGGGGYIAITNGTITRTATGGNNGTTNSTSLTEFPPNGATKGSAGINNAFASIYYIIAEDDSICEGNTATLTASIGGTPLQGTTIIWYDAIVGGNILGTGATFTTPVLNTTTTYYVGTCPGTYHQPVIVYVNNIKADAGSDVTICNGASTYLNATGGTIYSWSPSTGLNNASIANPVASPTSTTTYVVTITDAVGCSATDDVIVTLSGSINANAGLDVTICPNTTTTLNALGGDTYSWSPAASLSSTTIANPVASPNSTTTYTVTISNTAGCSVVDSVIVNVLQPVPANAGQDTTICTSTSAQLNATGGIMYNWSPATGLSNAAIANPIASPLSPITYTVLVTDNNGCSETDDIFIDVSSSLNVSIIPTSTNICPGENISLSANGGSNYTWSADSITPSANGAIITVSPLVTSTYTVTATSTGGCSGSATVTINVNPSIPVTVTPSDTNICPGSSVQLIATGANSYTWASSSTLSSTNGNIVTASPITTEIYTVTGTSLSGCTGSASVTVNVGTSLTATTSSTNANCGQPNGTVSVIPSGGSGLPYDYTWNTSPIQTTQTATNLAAGTYTVTVSCGGCSISVTATVDNSNGPTVTTTLISNAGCGIANGSVSATVSGGSAPYAYLWSNGITDSTLTNVASGTYYITVRDAAGCISSASVIISSLPGPSVSVASITNATCYLPNGEAIVNVTGTGPYTYSWNSVPVQTTDTLQNVPEGSYTVTVTDAGGCSSSINVNITQSGGLALSTSSTNEDCRLLNGTATVVATSGSGNYSYTWSTNPVQSTATITGIGSGLYTVTVTDGICTVTSDIAIQSNPGPTADFSLDPNVINSGEMVNFYDSSSGNVVSWDWEFGDGHSSSVLQNPFHEFTKDGYYLVTLIITDDRGCTDSTDEWVQVNDISTFYIPSSFTPNGDGKNDLFMPIGINFNSENYEMSIYDRWGKLIFHTATWGEGWNGTYNNEGGYDDVVMDVYIYKITRLINGRKHDDYGRVTIFF
ncbi:MAG TPA: gliding motility-associated C-terminal domain-containing protein [Bacteroidales bacterium]|nr:gliding motility-associated C-terminal domain-containing protein [Bacteroidales bacterium]HPS17018.1 gliding motility-associated C-terminal domain-containing protein [Bacteroidales bacterium]